MKAMLKVFEGKAKEAELRGSECKGQRTTFRVLLTLGEKYLQKELKE